MLSDRSVRIYDHYSHSCKARQNPTSWFCIIRERKACTECSYHPLAESTMAHHKLTLTRFVCRQRAVDLDENSPYFEEEMHLLIKPAIYSSLRPEFFNNLADHGMLSINPWSFEPLAGVNGKPE